MISVRKILRNWLFKEELKDLNLLKEQMKVQQDLNRNFIRRLNEKENLIKETAKRYIIEEFGEVACDINQYEPSWAVISIQGQKRDYIRFMNWKEKDLRHLRDFLRHFEGRSGEYYRISVDTPHNMPKKYFLDRL